MLWYGAEPSKEEALESHELARRVVDLLADKQAEEVVLLDIRKVTTFADYFVIASAMNIRQMQSLCEAVREGLAKEGFRSFHEEGFVDSGWVLLDYGGVIVHVFSPEQRRYYDLEGLWKSGVELVRIQ